MKQENQAMPKMFLDVVNNENAVEIKIYDRIGKESFWEKGSFSSDKLANELENAGGKPLNIYINSAGGEVFEGFAIYNALKRYQAKKTVIIDGLAASIASVIALAGDEVKMNKQSMFMIHNASSVCIGTAEEMRKTADSLEQVNKVISNTYIEHSNLTGEQVKAFMEEEKYFTPEECLNYGFIDEIVSEPQDEEKTDTAMTAFTNQLNARIGQLNELKNLAEQSAFFVPEPKQSTSKEEPKANLTKNFLLNFLNKEEI